MSAGGPLGRFITLEGGEGVGKSTQVRALAAALRERGIDVVETREPGGSEGAEAVRALLLEGGTERWSGRAEALLFAAARADHVEKTIRPALAAGHWVLCDRFVDSSRAYQGEAGGLGDAAILALHDFATGGFYPERTLLLHLRLEESSTREFARDDGRLDRFGNKSSAYHARVHGFFADLAERDPARVSLIDADGPVGEVTARLLAALADLL